MIDFVTITPDDLNNVLTRFYCSAKPQKGAEYHKNTLKGMRAAINRHIQDIGRHINIVTDTQFKSSNRVLNGLLKERVKSGTSMPTQHKEVITADDMQALRDYFTDAPSSPVILRQFVWFAIAFHFVTRGSETHFQLTPSSFSFNSDSHGEYVTINHETSQKNHQGGMYDKEENSKKVMYATGGALCPVNALKLLIEKTDPAAEKLFNKYNADAIHDPLRTKYWYNSNEISKRFMANFMPDISKAANTSQRYTNHCVRATAIQTLNDADIEARHIMFLSDHTSEGSIRSYNRIVSIQQKRKLSKTLSSAITGAKNDQTDDMQHLDTLPSSTALCPLPASNDDSNPTTFPASLVPMPTHPTSSPFPMSAYLTKNSTSISNPGFLSNSVFNNCSFSFGK